MARVKKAAGTIQTEKDGALVSSTGKGKYRKGHSDEDADGRRKIKENKRQEKKLGKKSEKPEEMTVFTSTQSEIPIVDVQNGVIISRKTGGGFQYSKIVEVTPTSLMMKSIEDMQLLMKRFNNVFKKRNTDLQFKVMATKADSTQLIANIYRYMEIEQNPNVLELQKQYMKLVTDISHRQGVTRRFFFILPYNRGSDSRGGESFEQIVQFLNYEAGRLAAELASVGNVSVEVLTGKEDEAVCEILYTMLRRRQSELLNFKDFKAQVDLRYKDEAAAARKPLLPFPATEYFAPKYIDARRKNYMIVDGKYYTFMYIPSSGYNSQTYLAWLSSVINCMEGLDIDIFFERIDLAKVRSKIKRHETWKRAQALNTRETDVDAERLDSQLGAFQYIRKAIADQEDFYYVSALLTVVADSVEELEAKRAFLHNMFTKDDMDIRVSNYMMKDSFFSAMPTYSLSKRIFTNARRNVTSYGATSFYPFVSDELQDRNGIMLGISTRNNTIVSIDQFDDKKYDNANIAIIGTTGSGKTFTLETMAMRMRENGVQVFIIAPLSGREDYLRACTRMGGTFIEFAAGSTHTINIMEIREIDTTVADLIDGERNTSRVSLKVKEIVTFFSLIVQDITSEEKAIISELAQEVYLSMGMTTDNSTLLDPNTGRYRVMPTLQDMYDALITRSEEVPAQSKQTRRLATLLRPYVNGYLDSFNGQTNVDVTNQYTVLDISNLSGNDLIVGMFTALSLVWDKTREDRTKKKAIIIDEAWKLLSTNNEDAAQQVEEIFRTIRKYRGSAIAASQNIQDFSSEQGKNLLALAQIKFILPLYKDAAKAAQKVLGLTDNEVEMVVENKRGTALMLIKNNSLPVRIVATQQEFDLITTSGREIAEQVNRARESKEREVANVTHIIDLDDVQ